MDEQDVEIFLNNLTLKLNVYCFDYLASIPLPFSDLAKVNRVSDKEAVRSLGLPTGYGKPLKEFLKPIKVHTLIGVVGLLDTSNLHLDGSIQATKSGVRVS
jgi:hypothetical protein